MQNGHFPNGSIHLGSEGAVSRGSSVCRCANGCMLLEQGLHSQVVASGCEATYPLLILQLLLGLVGIKILRARRISRKPKVGGRRQEEEEDLGGGVSRRTEKKGGINLVHISHFHDMQGNVGQITTCS